MKVQKILVATDFSSTAESAIEMATKLARDFNAPLIIAHVKPTPEVPGADDDVFDQAEDVERRQLEAIEPADSRITYEHHLLHGRPSDQLLHLAEREAVDLIVIGTHGETNSPGVTMGVVAQAVLSRAPCAVVSVKQPTAPGANSH
jgi:nucleotide-binding universal stress UspA family protein